MPPLKRSVLSDTLGPQRFLNTPSHDSFIGINLITLRLGGGMPPFLTPELVAVEVRSRRDSFSTQSFWKTHWVLVYSPARKIPRKLANAERDTINPT